MAEGMTTKQWEALAHPATWVEPSAGLEDAIVRAVLNDESVPSNVTAISDRRGRAPRRRMLPAAAAAAAAIAIGVGSVVATSGGTAPAFTAELTATGLVPGAHASADIARNDGGFRVALDASGLQPLPEGEFYEAWLKDPAGTLVPIGTFSSSDARVTLWSGVSPAGFASLTVTIEQADNDQASSGRVVLRGDVRPG
jgi:hypothetical protein